MIKSLSKSTNVSSIRVSFVLVGPGRMPRRCAAPLTHPPQKKINSLPLKYFFPASIKCRSQLQIFFSCNLFGCYTLVEKKMQRLQFFCKIFCKIFQENALTLTNSCKICLELAKKFCKNTSLLQNFCKSCILFGRILLQCFCFHTKRIRYLRF